MRKEGGRGGVGSRVTPVPEIRSHQFLPVASYDSYIASWPTYPSIRCNEGNEGRIEGAWVLWRERDNRQRCSREPRQLPGRRRKRQLETTGEPSNT